MDVLRHIRKAISEGYGDMHRICNFLADLEAGDCQVVHPMATNLIQLLNLKGVEVEALFVAGYEKPGEYSGAFLNFSSRAWSTVDLRDFDHQEDRYHEALQLPSELIDIQDLEPPKARTAGGLLICRQAGEWLPIGILPTYIPVAHAVVHLRAAYRYGFHVLTQMMQEAHVPADTPMIEAARNNSMREYLHPAQRTLLSMFFDALASQELAVAVSEGSRLAEHEESDFYRSDNQLQLVFVFGVHMGLAPNRTTDYWSVPCELMDVPHSLVHDVEERLMRFIRARRRIFPDEELCELPVQFQQPLPTANIHLGWVVTHHPQDGYSSTLLYHRELDQHLALSCLQEAIHEYFL